MNDPPNQHPSTHLIAKYVFTPTKSYFFEKNNSKMEQTNALGSIQVSAEFPASIIREQTPSASLPYYFNEACNTSKTAYLYIINGKTVAVIPTSHGIVLFDSHFHGISGAFVAIAPLDAAYELLAWFKRINSIPHNLGSVTNVSF